MKWVSGRVGRDTCRNNVPRNLILEGRSWWSDAQFKNSWSFTSISCTSWRCGARQECRLWMRMDAASYVFQHRMETRLWNWGSGVDGLRGRVSDWAGLLSHWTSFPSEALSELIPKYDSHRQQMVFAAARGRIPVQPLPSHIALRSPFFPMKVCVLRVDLNRLKATECLLHTSYFPNSHK